MNSSNRATQEGLPDEDHSIQAFLQGWGGRQWRKYGTGLKQKGPASLQALVSFGAPEQMNLHWREVVQIP